MATSSSTRSRPTGRAAVRTAVLDSAIVLFAERGPASVSLRDIAAAANVNLGLLHRHFGSKAELITAAIQHFRAQTRAKVDAAIVAPDFADDLIAILREDAAVYPRLMAWSILDGVEPESLQESYPSVVAIVGRLEAAGLEPALARARAAVIFGTAVGFVFFEPALRIAAELDTVPDALVDNTLAETVRYLFELPG